MKVVYVFVVLGLSATSGCRSAQDSQPLPTLDPDGKLSIPAGYKPQPDTDLSKVDCRGYLEMNPAEVRNMARDLCLQNRTQQERADNAYCKIHRVTEACLAKGVAKASQ